MNEFSLIEKYFLPLSKGKAEADQFQNDAATLNIPNGKQLVVTSDTLVADVHFFADQSPETIAKKALRTNLSDLAAMGAKPYCYQLCLSMPKVDESWLKAFCNALDQDQKLYGIFLSGGDTTSTSGPLSISITAMGLLDEGQSVPRKGAQANDFIVLTGTIGDAYCGLQSLRGDMQDVSEACIDLYYKPESPVEFGGKISGLVNAALDISDGLVADLGHITKASNMTALIELDSLIFSQDVQTLLDANKVTKAELLSGGDDYQLLMSVSPDKMSALESFAKSCNIQLQQIGIMQEGEAEVIILDQNGLPMEITKAGWQHF